MTLLKILLCITVGCFLASSLYADIYEWTDEDGVKHYTNYAPPPEASVLIENRSCPMMRPLILLAGRLNENSNWSLHVWKSLKEKRSLNGAKRKPNKDWWTPAARQRRRCVKLKKSWMKPGMNAMTMEISVTLIFHAAFTLTTTLTGTTAMKLPVFFLPNVPG